MGISKKVSTAPRVLRTDVEEIRIYPNDCIVKFHRRGIYLGEPSTKPRPEYSLFVKNYENYPDILAALIEYLKEFHKELVEKKEGKYTRSRLL